MSGEQFLRAHGWKLGQGLWWHERLPGAGHDFVVALLQQAQWLATQRAEYGRWMRRAMAIMERAETLPALTGTDVGILMSALLCEVP